MENSVTRVKTYYDVRQEVGFSASRPEFSYLEYLEFSSRLEFRKFRMLGQITNAELSQARRNIDGLILALQEV